MTDKFHLERTEIYNLMLFSGIALTVGTAVFLLPEYLLIKLFGIAIVLLGFYMAALAVWRFRLREPVLIVDSNGIFDKQSMSEAVPWSAVTGVDADIRRDDGLFSARTHVIALEIRVVSSEPFTRNLKGLSGWWRGNTQRSKNGDRFFISPAQFKEEAETLLKAVAEAGPPGAIRAYIEYLHALRMPAVTRSKITEALSSTKLRQLGFEETCAVLASALEGPLSVSAEKIVAGLADRCVQLDKPKTRKVVSRDLETIDGQKCLVADCLNKALIRAGFPPVASDTDQAMLDQYVEKRDTRRPFLWRLSSKVIFYGLIFAALYGGFWLVRLGYETAKSYFAR